MSRESRLRKRIREQYSPAMEELWKKIEARMETQTEETEDDIGQVLAKKSFWSKKNIILISAGFLLAALTVVIILINVLPSPGPLHRYCVSGEYYSEVCDTSIEDYAKQNNLDLLYFDGDNIEEIVEKKQYKLMDTNEIICFYEEFIDASEYYVLLQITDANTDIDFFDSYSNFCTNKITINNININCGVNSFHSYAKFTYNNWNYYLRIQDCEDENYLYTVLENLIK